MSTIYTLARDRDRINKMSRIYVFSIVGELERLARSAEGLDFSTLTDYHEHVNPAHLVNPVPALCLKGRRGT
jgi:hypothetical protein